MYTSFHVKNFRGFADLELTDLARINLIAGQNNVGKTALLEAVYLHARAYNPQEILNLNRVRGLEFELASDASLIFPMRDTSVNIVLEGIDRNTGFRSATVRLVRETDELARLNLKITADGHTNGFSSFSDGVQVIALDYIQETDNLQGTAYMTRPDQTEVGLIGVLPPPMMTDFISAQGRPIVVELAGRFSKLELAGQHDILLQWLRILEPRLKRISVLLLNDKPALWAEVEETRLPLNLLGDGLNRLSNIVIAIIQNTNGIVLIDEIENGLHHSVLVDVWKAIATAAREFNVQIFATTHSLEMIRAAHEAFKDDEPYDFRLHRLDRDETTGVITPVTYDEEIMEAAIEANFEVR